MGEFGWDPDHASPRRRGEAREENTTLLYAVRSGRISTVRLTLDYGADPIGGNPSPMEEAVIRARLDMRGAGEAVLAAAKERGLSSMVDMLENLGVRGPSEDDLEDLEHYDYDYNYNAWSDISDI